MIENNFISLLIELVQLYSTYGQVGSCASVENYRNWFKNHQSNSVKIFNFVKNTLTRIDHKELIMGFFYKERFGSLGFISYKVILFLNSLGKWGK